MISPGAEFNISVTEVSLIFKIVAHNSAASRPGDDKLSSLKAATKYHVRMCEGGLL